MLRVIMKPPKINPTPLKLTCNEYGYYVDEVTRMKTFGVIGKRDLQEFINSFVDCCDYSVIMKSLSPSVAEFEDFEDVLEIADNIHDVNDVLSYSSVLSEQFNLLPLEVKEHYGNNYELFARDVIGGGFADFVAKKYQPVEGSQSPSVDPVADSEGFQGTDQRRDDLVAELLKRVDDLTQKVGGKVNE